MANKVIKKNKINKWLFLFLIGYAIISVTGSFKFGRNIRRKLTS